MKLSFLIVFVALHGVEGNGKVGEFVPVALKKHLPTSVLKELNKLESKDLKAIERVAARWPQFKSVEQFEKTLLLESRPLKKFVDSAIRAGHESLDHLVDKMHPETIKMAKQAGRIMAKASQELKSLVVNGNDKAKENLRVLFPKTSFALSHPQAHITAVSYCGLLGNGGLGGLLNGGGGLGSFLNGGAGLGGLLNGGGGLNSNFGAQGALNRGGLGSGWLRLWG